MRGYPVRLTFAAVVVVCLARGAVAQVSPGDSALVLYEQANLLAGRGGAQNLRRAVELFREALQLFRRADRMADEAATLSTIGGVFTALGQLDSALAQYQWALRFTEAIGDSVGQGRNLHEIGVVYSYLGHPDSALAYHRSELAIYEGLGDPLSEAVARYFVGEVLLVIKHPDSALAYFRAAETTARRENSRLLQAMAVGGIGGAYAVLGRLDSALTLSHAALSLMSRTGNHPLLEGRLQGAIGGVFQSLRRPDSALAYHHRSLTTARGAHDLYGEVAGLANIGFVYVGISRPDSALAYFRQSRLAMQGIGVAGGEGRVLGGMGLAFALQSQTDSAVAYYSNALRLARRSRDQASQALWLTGLGMLQYKLDRPESALAYYREALPLARFAGDRQHEQVVLTLLGVLYGDASMPRLRSLTTAVAYYDSAAALHASVLAMAGSDADRVTFAEALRDLHLKWALAWLGREAELGPRISARASLAAVERGRAQALLDLLRRTADSAQDVAGVGSYLTRPREDLAAEALSLVAPLRRAGVAALSYLVTPETLVVWLVTPAGEVRVAVRADTLRAWVAMLRAGLGVGQEAARDLGVREPAGRSDMGGRAAGRLAQWLVPAEVLRAVPVGAELVIVPHGVLGLVPFALLRVGDSAQPLGLRNALRYGPSFASLRALDVRAGAGAMGAERRQRWRGALIVGNSELPGADSEARWVAAQLGVTPLVGPQATESAVRARLGAAPLVHLATHGSAYGTEAQVRDSYVALVADSGNDGMLTLGEVVDDSALGLQAELVVLSACQTGLGDLKEAEGTVGLQRGLLARGARSVLVSLWKVNDRATAALMEGYYRHWLDDVDGPSKAEALRRAQGDVRGYRDAEGGQPWVEPQYWAAFQLVGAR